MLIYTHIITNRCRYIIDLVFGDLLGVSYSVTEDPDVYSLHEKEKIAYTTAKPETGFFLRSTPLLFENNISGIEPDVFPFAGTKAFFKTPGADFAFDILAASFYLVSRYEEYRPSPADQFGRYQAKNSLAGKHDFLQTPVINYWVQALKRSLAVYYPSLSFPEKSFRSVTSFDIDVAYAFKGRSFFRNAFAILKELVRGRYKNFQQRMQVLRGHNHDPYDTYEEIRKMVYGFHTETIFFFLLAGSPTRFDRNLSPESTLLRKLITHVSTFGNIGIHPSYFSSEKPALLQQEKQKLEEISGRHITASRQHYLRFSLPDTYLNLIKAGITDDYSMGYAEIPGFRAGICTPFTFYDLEAGQATQVKIHPVAYMDGSFIEDLHMRPVESVEMISRLIDTVREVKGVFMCIWHNHTISDYGEYTGWRQVLQKTLQMVSDQ